MNNWRVIDNHSSIIESKEALYFQYWAYFGVKGHSIPKKFEDYIAQEKDLHHQ